MDASNTAAAVFVPSAGAAGSALGSGSSATGYTLRALFILLLYYADLGTDIALLVDLASDPHQCVAQGAAHPRRHRARHAHLRTRASTHVLRDNHGMTGPPRPGLLVERTHFRRVPRPPRASCCRHTMTAPHMRSCGVCACHDARLSTRPGVDRPRVTPSPLCYQQGGDGGFGGRRARPARGSHLDLRPLRSRRAPVGDVVMLCAWVSQERWLRQA